MLPGLSKEIWDYIHRYVGVFYRQIKKQKRENVSLFNRYSGLGETYVEPANTWGSYKVRIYEKIRSLH